MGPKPTPQWCCLPTFSAFDRKLPFDAHFRLLADGPISFQGCHPDDPRQDKSRTRWQWAHLIFNFASLFSNRLQTAVGVESRIRPFVASNVLTDSDRRDGDLI